MSTTLKSTDIYILRSVIILIGIGTVSMYSASSIYAEYKYDDYLHYLTKQVIWLPIAVIGYFFSSRFNYYYFKNYIYYLVGFTWLVIFLAFMFNNTGMPSRYLIIAGKNWMTTSDLARIMLIILTLQVKVCQFSRDSNPFQASSRLKVTIDAPTASRPCCN